VTPHIYAPRHLVYRLHKGPPVHPWILALIGGVIIGGAAALLMRSHGRIAGISGILAASLEATADRTWRVAFLAGLAVAGLGAAIVAPSAVTASPRTLPIVALAGLLVGVGTRLGGGCTSGHGVCGLARLSTRSLVAVVTFMLTGALTVWIGGGL
jgi:uncharacterized membrane protein YedE/YeeE